MSEKEYGISVMFKNGVRAYTFKTEDATIDIEDYVVVNTEQGLNLARCVTPVKELSSFNLTTEAKPIVRKAMAEDRKQYEENLHAEKEAFVICEKAIAEQGLDMRLIRCEYNLDRSKVLFVYVAEDRVDFRELLKQLASQLHCRIELRQVGARDKAKMIGGIGICGHETCCSRFMNSFDVVSINMAKNQMLALNVSKLSGQCGKLMCCLKYENEDYKQMREGLPKMNAQVEYEGNLYRVTSMNVISKTARLENRDSFVTISLDELQAKAKVRKGEAPKKKRQDDHEKTEKL